MATSNWQQWKKLLTLVGALACVVVLSGANEGGCEMPERPLDDPTEPDGDGDDDDCECDDDDHRPGEECEALEAELDECLDIFGWFDDEGEPLPEGVFECEAIAEEVEECWAQVGDDDPGRECEERFDVCEGMEEMCLDIELEALECHEQGGEEPCHDLDMIVEECWSGIDDCWVEAEECWGDDEPPCDDIAERCDMLMHEIEICFDEEYGDPEMCDFLMEELDECWFEVDECESHGEECDGFAEECMLHEEMCLAFGEECDHLTMELEECFARHGDDPSCLELEGFIDECFLESEWCWVEVESCWMEADRCHGEGGCDDLFNECDEFSEGCMAIEEELAHCFEGFGDDEHCLFLMEELDFCWMEIDECYVEAEGCIDERTDDCEGREGECLMLDEELAQCFEMSGDGPMDCEWLMIEIELCWLDVEECWF